ncbi:MAG: UDP-N-acetylenolpyruvoylglucosamine reductase, partial [Candidatus Omnitrophota bacterium]
GSFFKNIEATNPADRRQAAGWFLDQVGAKAMSVGGAGVFEKHANILVKKAKNCTACDVFALSQRMEKAVAEKFGIVLDREVRMMGNFQ